MFHVTTVQKENIHLLEPNGYNTRAIPKSTSDWLVKLNRLRSDTAHFL
jgi:hypothetical protein